MNTLYYGDNLAILRQNVADETVDLVYLDPPFNSKRDYNLLFKQRKGEDSPAQIMAFEDTWSWSQSLYQQFIQDESNGPLLELMDCLHRLLGRSEMMAYLLMMAPRLLELYRKLKPTGTLYLHCDPIASHYLKMVLDVVFGPTRFGNEIIWKRTSAKGHAFTRLANNHDVILRYTKSEKWTWNPQYTGHDPEYVAKFYRHVEPVTGRRYRLDNLANPNKDRPNLTYEFMGVTRVWRWTEERMHRAKASGLIVQSAPGRVPALKRYLDEQEGTPVGDVWNDILPVQSQSAERSGYPTQKPLALLERIISASTNEGDLVLDPFCGCGTAVVAADRLKRRWSGIDVTYLAIAEIEFRLSNETHAAKGKTYDVEGSPRDAYAAQQFFEQTAPQNHKPFEMWAVSLVKGQPIEKKGADRGIDGKIPIYNRKNELEWAVIQVKGGHVHPGLIRDFGHVITREKAVFGLFICLQSPTRAMTQEAADAGVVTGYGSRQIQRLQILTVRDLLEQQKQFDLPVGYVPARYQGAGKPQELSETMDFDLDAGTDTGQASARKPE